MFRGNIKKQLTKALWNLQEFPGENKASFLLGDLSRYGISCIKKIQGAWNTTWFEFYIYVRGNSKIVLVVELPFDFTLKDVERSIIRLHEYGGMIASNDNELMDYWRKNIREYYDYDHAKYSALKFLEALRKKLLTDIKEVKYR